MRRSSAMSLDAVAASTVVGYVVAVLAQLAILPVFGLQASLVQHLRIGGALALVSIAGSYALWRLFEAVRARQAEPAP